MMTRDDDTVTRTPVPDPQSQLYTCFDMCCNVCVSVCVLQCVLICVLFLKRQLFSCVESLVCCSVLQCVAVCCSVLQCVAVCCSMLQSVAACCSVLLLFYTVNLVASWVWRISLWVTTMTTSCTYRVAKTQRMPYLFRSFSAKEPYN